jgi:hypothetical protein
LNKVVCLPAVRVLADAIDGLVGLSDADLLNVEAKPVAGVTESHIKDRANAFPLNPLQKKSENGLKLLD